MPRSIRTVAATAVLLLAGISASRAEPLWSSDGDASAAVSRLLQPVRSSQAPALLRLLTNLSAPSTVFAAAADRVTTDGPLASDAATATSLPTPTAAIPAIGGRTVLDEFAFEAALDARLAAGPPVPALAVVWKDIGEAYRANFGRPFWQGAEGPTAAARAALVRIAHADEDGLTVPAIAPSTLSEGSPEQSAAQDLALTGAVIVYARQAAGERVDPARISRLITARPVLPKVREIIAAVSSAGEGAGDALANFNPPHADYRALRTKLAELRRASTPMAMRIPAGPALRVGMRDARVKLVRARFGLEIASAESPDEVLYDTRVADAVAGFQKQNGLAPSGILTPRTVSLLSGGEPRRLENEIIANMERWRWMPRDLGRDRIEVDVPNFTLALVRDGIVVHRARVIVGKPENPTPIFSNAMKFIVVNPSWFIPPSILKKEVLPKLAADPTYLQRLGYEMTVRHGQVSIRQPPGERNALGRIKFMFPNEHAVYLHDTPSRGLFTASRRAFSHGCVRVDDPLALAAAVLRGPWTESRIKAMVGGAERTLNLPAQLPIHLEYFTLRIGPDGRLQFRDDLYGYDRALIRALALND